MIPEMDHGLRERVLARTRELLRRAEERYGSRLPMPEIRFDLRGRAAGQARMLAARRFRLRYNPELLAGNPVDFIAQTVAHEVAHLVAYEVFGRAIRPHGPEWRSVMALFGVPALRCHNYPVAASEGRRLVRYAYHCGCGTHELSSIRHNRVRRGQRYCCRACRQPLRRGRHPDDAAPN